MNNIRKPATLLLALAAATAMPLAFAQQTNPAAGQAPTASPPPGATTTAPTAPTAADPAGTAAPAAPAQQLTWADVDADGNGTISKPESAALPSLAQVFDQADGDGDGELTADEYKAFVAANTGGGAADDGAGGTD